MKNKRTFEEWKERVDALMFQLYGIMDTSALNEGIMRGVYDYGSEPEKYVAMIAQKHNLTQGD